MWEKETRIYLPGALGDNIMQMPYALSCAGITKREEIYPALSLYMDISKHHYIRGNPASADKAKSVLKWQMDLLRLQPYVKDIFDEVNHDRAWIKREGILDTDYQRSDNSIIDMGRGDICWRNNAVHRCLKYWSADEPWVFLPEDESFNLWRSKIVISATPRYANENINWSSLHKYGDRCVFVGTEADHDGWYWRSHLAIPYHKVSNFIEMAQVIKHCAFMVGTQSFPICLAESMKSNRIIIQAVRVPDVIPHGGVGNAVVTEEDFGKTLRLYADAFL